MNLRDLQAATGYDDLSELLQVPAASLARTLYGSRRNYFSFEIAKRGGGSRLIESPRGIVRRVQQALVPVLVEAYRPSRCAHGFIKSRSVVSNARVHVGKRTVLNIDLLNFFHSVSFERVRGLFLASPFNFQWPVANILAQACCTQGRLPAGGITSPVLSNILLHRLDRRLGSLATRHGGCYTRYADDLTLSFDRSLSQIPEIATRDHAGALILSRRLTGIVHEEGFEVNDKKVRIAEGSQRKVVTGVVVNERLNVRRHWIKKLECMVFAIERHGVDSVAARLLPDLDSGVGRKALLRQVHGRLAYLLMVRGRGDWVSAELANRFNRAHDDPLLKVPDVEIVSENHRASRALVVVTSSSTSNPPFDEWDEQGTGFIVEGGLIVTAFHVVSIDSEAYPHIFVRKERKAMVTHRCELVAFDSHSDVAVLRLKKHDSDLIRIRAALASDEDVSEQVVSMGYPAYSVGHLCSKQNHQVTLRRTTSGVAKLVVNGNIHGGLSGGPVFGESARVVGLVHRGSSGGYANEVVGTAAIKSVLSKV